MVVLVASQSAGDAVGAVGRGADAAIRPLHDHHLGPFQRLARIRGADLAGDDEGGPQRDGQGLVVDRLDRRELTAEPLVFH